MASYEKEKILITESESSPPREDLFLAMADSAPILLWASGPDKRCFFVNKVWLQFTGKTKDAEIGDGWVEDLHPDDRENYIKIYINSFDKREKFQVEYRLRRHDGNYRWILSNCFPYYDKKQTFGGYIGSCVDIHEIKELETRKSNFITTASHELKTPVTSLNVYLHLLTEYFKDKKEDKYSGYAQNAVIQVKKITGLINQLLDLSRIQADSLNFEWSVFAFCDLVSNIVNKIQATVASHRIELSGYCRSLIKGDKERLSQAIENLLTNAIKYSPKRDRILVQMSEDTKNIKLSVIDFGIGIDKNHLSQIFDRFYRIAGAKEETFPGMGIGLYLSKQIIDKHGGKIWVESIKNRETKFNFQIPFVTKN